MSADNSQKPTGFTPAAPLVSFPVDVTTMRPLPYNDADRLFFGRFGFAIAPAHHAATLLVNTHDNIWIPVALGNNKTTNLAAVRAVCQGADPISGASPKHSNLLDSLNHKWIKLLCKCCTCNDMGGLIDWIERNIPSAVLNQCSPKVVCESFYASKDGEKKSSPDYKIKHLDFPEINDIVDFMVNHYEYFCGLPQMQMQMPVMFTNDVSVPAIHYLDMDKIAKDEPCPTWDDYMLRYPGDQASVVMAFIWSILDAKNNGRQILYIVDKGYTGKTVLIRALTKVLGEDLVIGLNKDSLSNQFGLAKIYDKRLVVYDDNKNPNIVRGEKMKTLSGCGICEVELKGKNSFTARLQCKVMVASNDSPTINPEETSEITRLIVVRPVLPEKTLKEIYATDADGNLVKDPYGRLKPVGDSAFEEKLNAEMAGFLYKCRQAYAERCPSGADIVLPDSMIESLYTCTDDAVDCYEEILQKYFVLDAEAWMSPSELQTVYNEAVTASSMSRGNSECSYHKFTVFLENKGVFKKSARLPGKSYPTRVYSGIRRKDLTSNNLVSMPLSLPAMVKLM